MTQKFTKNISYMIHDSLSTSFRALKDWKATIFCCNCESNTWIFMFFFFKKPLKKLQFWLWGVLRFFCKNLKTYVFYNPLLLQPTSTALIRMLTASSLLYVMQYFRVIHFTYHWNFHVYIYIYGWIIHNGNLSSVIWKTTDLADSSQFVFSIMDFLVLVVQQFLLVQSTTKTK